MTDNGIWQGNPSISLQVSRYMVSLRRRKVGVYPCGVKEVIHSQQVRAGEVAMSSRAINPELLKMLMDFNRLPENWNIQPYAPNPRTSRGRDLQKWGGGRSRRLLHAIYLLAFWCLLRFDEVLRIQFHDLEIVSPTCVKLTLPFRKTHQYGGASAV
jgi:hypothetical protein